MGLEFARFYPTSAGDEREGAEGLIVLVFLYNMFKNSTDVEKKDQNECSCCSGTGDDSCSLRGERGSG